MTEIIEGNRAIALFMGFRVFEKRYPRNHGIGAPEAEWKDCIVEKLKYHKSWDALMPVFEKIGNYRWPAYYGPSGKSNDDGPYDDCVWPRTFGMRDKDGKYMVRFNASVLFSADTLIEATWLSVVDFAKWYNQQPVKQ